VKIGVLLKQVPDTETKIRVTADGEGIEEGEVKWIISPYDEFAVEEAIKLKEAGNGEEVVVFALGPARVLDSARTALAMGADRAVILDDDGFAGSDAWGTARALAAAFEKEEIGIAFAGGQAIDLDQGQVPGAVASILGWPSASWINGFEFGGETATIRRPVGGGNVEVVNISVPCVLSCGKGLNEPRYASLPGIMKAKRKPVTKYSPDDLGLDGEVGADANVVALGDYQLPPGRPAGRILEGELSDQVAELVRALREDAKVL
jgi:electron transfer flavoprotein beta subunit